MVKQININLLKIMTPKPEQVVAICIYQLNETKLIGLLLVHLDLKTRKTYHLKTN